MIREWIEQAAACAGAQEYLSDARGPGSLSYAGLLDTVSDVERRLDAAGLPLGARIVVRLDEPIEYATALVAIVAAGRVAVPLDPGAPDSDIARILGVARPAGVVYRVDQTREATGPFEITEFDFDVIDDVIEPQPVRAGTDNSGGIFLCTSGTTGTPKGILLREEQLAHVAASVVDCHRLTAAARGYSSLPLFHVTAKVVALPATLGPGARLPLDRKFSRRASWELIGDRKIT